MVELADALGRLAPSINRMTELVIFGMQLSLVRFLPSLLTISDDTKL